MTEPMTMFKLRDEMSKETENVVNRLHRRCKIGRVVKKFQIHGGQMVVPGMLIKPPSMPFWGGGYVHTTSSGDVPFVQ